MKIVYPSEVAARNAKINLSQTLQQALKAELGVE